MSSTASVGNGSGQPSSLPAALAASGAIGTTAATGSNAATATAAATTTTVANATTHKSVIPTATTSKQKQQQQNNNKKDDNDDDDDNDGKKRLSKTAAYLPFVYGSIAFYLGKKADEFQTHEWTLYVRGPNDEDLSVVISKVIFQLHASFAKPVRELDQPPFQVTERGWGEFEAQIRIIWKDPEEKPTIVNHLIKLYPPGAPPNALPTNNPDEPVVDETYDEVVFTDPNETFYRQLTQISLVPKIEFSHKKYVQRTFSDEEDFLALLEAQKFLQGELSRVKGRFKLVSDDLDVVDQALMKVQQQRQQSRESAAKKSKAAAAPRKPRPAPQTKKAKTS